MLLGQFHEVFLPFEGTDADVWRRLRKSQQSQKTRKAFEQTRVLGRFQNDSNVWKILRTRLPCVIWVDISQIYPEMHGTLVLIIMLDIRLWTSSGYQHGYPLYNYKYTKPKNNGEKLG